MLHIAPEKAREHQTHDKEGEERVQDAPPHTKDGTLIFLLEVALHQLLKKEAAFL